MLLDLSGNGLRAANPVQPTHLFAVVALPLPLLREPLLRCVELTPYFRLPQLGVGKLGGDAVNFGLQRAQLGDQRVPLGHRFFCPLGSLFGELRLAARGRDFSSPGRRRGAADLRFAQLALMRVLVPVGKGALPVAAKAGQFIHIPKDFVPFGFELRSLLAYLGEPIGGGLEFAARRPRGFGLNV